MTFSFEQALYIAVLGVIWHIEFNGGGVHQWNLTYFNFVKLEYVSERQWSQLIQRDAHSPAIHPVDHDFQGLVHLGHFDPEDFNPAPDLPDFRPHATWEWVCILDHHITS